MAEISCLGLGKAYGNLRPARKEATKAEKPGEHATSMESLEEF